MRKSFQNICAAIVALGIALVPCLAADKPTATDAASPITHGQIVRDTSDALRVEDMTTEELQQRLAEFETGKRDDRDGYIILNQLWINCQGQNKTNTPKCQHINKLREELLGKHPDFYRLQDFQLSDRLNYFAKQKQGKDRARAAAQSWVPPDSVPTRILINDRHAVGVFQFHLEFFNLPEDVQLGPKGALVRDGSDVALSALHAVKKINFVHTVETLPDSAKVPSRFLACTSMLHDYYNRMTPEEEKNMAALGHRYALPWINKKAEHEQICAVLSMKGDLLFSFGTQHLPDKLFAPLDFSADGKKAVVMLGEKVVEEGEDSPTAEVGKIRSILIWTEEKGLKTISLSDKTMGRWQVQNKYRLGQLGDMLAR